MAFNHGAVGHPASREQRSKISSGAISLESLWSSALLELNLLCHRVRIHSEGRMSNFFHRQQQQTATAERHSMFAKCFMLLKKTSSWSGDVNAHSCFPPFKLRWTLLNLFFQGENGAFSQDAEFPYKIKPWSFELGSVVWFVFQKFRISRLGLVQKKGWLLFWRSAISCKYEKRGVLVLRCPILAWRFHLWLNCPRYDHVSEAVRAPLSIKFNETHPLAHPPTQMLRGKRLNMRKMIKCDVSSKTTFSLVIKHDGALEIKDATFEIMNSQVTKQWCLDW